MPIASMTEIFNSNSRILHKVENGECSCIFPLNIGEHWITLILDTKAKCIVYFDSLGQDMVPEIYNSVRSRFPSWHVINNKIRTQSDGYQCDIWTFIITNLYLPYITEQRQSQEVQTVDLMELLNRNKIICLNDYKCHGNQEPRTKVRQDLRERLKIMHENGLTKFEDEELEESVNIEVLSQKFDLTNDDSDNQVSEEK